MRDFFFCLGAAAAQPLIDDCHYTVQIERHRVMPLLLRIIKPLEYRIEDARIESLVTCDRPHSRRIIDGGGEDRPVLFNELKIRKKVVGCDQYQRDILA